RETGTPIKYQKGVESEHGFKEVSEDQIIKGYEHAKGHHVLIKPEEIGVSIWSRMLRAWAVPP
ncbi:MAG: hypothetical protein ACXWKB_06295, partial [Methyloceanibacter sp.]